jgi:hypothetical protein
MNRIRGQVVCTLDFERGRTCAASLVGPSRGGMSRHYLISIRTLLISELAERSTDTTGVARHVARAASDIARPCRLKHARVFVADLSEGRVADELRGSLTRVTRLTWLRYPSESNP